MKFPAILIFITALLTASLTAMANQSVIKALSAFAWEKRQILLFAPDEQHADYQRFIAAVENQSAELAERHLQVWYLVAEQSVKLDDDVLQTKLAVSDFQTAYGVVKDEFRVILIGYDQGEKRRQDSADLEQIFAEVDQMPMRIEEMKADAVRLKNQSE